MAAIAVGGKLPDGIVTSFDEEGNFITVKVHEWARGRKIILFGIPGGFTTTSSLQQFPGFVEKADDLVKIASDDIALLAVADRSAMKKWGEAYPEISSRISLFADENAEYTQKLGLEPQLGALGMQSRSRRFSLLADNLTVKILHVGKARELRIQAIQEALLELLNAVEFLHVLLVGMVSPRVMARTKRGSRNLFSFGSTSRSFGRRTSGAVCMPWRPAAVSELMLDN
eukprot:TRINITY_DN4020_c0_g1_i1.p1 TRINITY_DN4020_c0_g1~~TRINITY_DN4020_c0_g1_i1.p1  ORF type:complete len:228 (+),score=41.77 TRINITY_DN4020_c0_g1_i1:111-794(+)